MHAQQPNNTQGKWAKLLILLVLVLVSCKPTVPSDYIQPGDMEDLLYDYHIAMSMAAIKNATPTEQEAYKLAVFKRHDVSESEFSKSLQYYMRHTERLKKMYENIDERLQRSPCTRCIGVRLQPIRRSIAQGRHHERVEQGKGSDTDATIARQLQIF